MALTPAAEGQGDGPRFLIEKQLGEGGFGKVYLGMDTRLKRKVAIKVLNQEISEVADSAGAAFDEARALAGIEHRHVVPVYDAGRTEKGEILIVSKFIEGCTLDEALTRGQLPREEFLKRVLEVCEALRSVHEAGIIHRDIKPDNILLDGEGKSVLIDFGIAATLDGVRWLRQAGTPKYMSPEQARGQDHLVDAQSDLYSLGAVLFRGLMGDTLKGESTGMVTSESSEQMMEYRLEALDEDLPADLAAICQKALAIPKSDRYESADAFARDLRHALSGKVAKREAFEEAPVVPRGLRSFGEEDAGFFLKLVPGRREPQSGLPSCIHQWKTRIEDRGHSGTTPFRVGLLYGPSGSGKSSLLKAGLLPQLDESIIVVRFDASSGETEEHFKKVLCQKFPHLDSGESLGWLLGRLRRGGLPLGEKLLIVIDQFEQWLHAHPDRISTSVLTKALRQCDGSRIQALITLRDEFWRPVSRLMSELDAPMRQGENIALVEPFDRAHGRRVLESLGRGLGCLEGKLKRNQREFLDEAIELISDGRKVSPLRIPLLAQIFEKREWTPEALCGIDTDEDLGSVYLDHAFYDDDSPLRGREELAKKFLEELLPEKRSVIRGAGVSAKSLKESLGVGDHEFGELVHLLDFDLRLITPVAAEKGRHYQLSHDYLVRALRHWFSDAQKKSLRGLALWRLENQTEEWLGGDRKKLLPKLSEWLWFRLMTPRAARSSEAQQLIKAANRKYWGRIFIWGSGLTVVAFVIISMVMQSRAKDSVEQLISARPAGLEMALGKVESLSWWSKELAEEEFASRSDPEEKWRSALPLAQDGQEYQARIVEGLLGAHPEEVKAILPRLQPYSKETLILLGQEAFAEEHPERGIRAACALAEIGLEDERWSERSETILDWLGTVEARMDWAPMLVPVASYFEEELRERVRKGGDAPALLLGLLHAKNLEDLLGAFFECQPADVPIFRDLIATHSKGVSRCLEIAKDLEVEHDRRARAIAVLLLSGEFPKLIKVDDLNLNAQVIFRSVSVGSNDLIRYLDECRDDEVWKRVLLLLLSEKEKEMILPEDYRVLKAQVDRLYSSHPDAGIHSAAELVLRRWGEEPPEEKPEEDADWFFSPDTGMTFVIFEPPKPLKYGAKRFAMATSELNEMVIKLQNNSIFPEGASPYRSTSVGGVREMMGLCDFLSREEGLDSCYEFVGMTEGLVPQKMWTPRKDHLELNGYRIPTEEEWLWACLQDHQYPGVYGDNSPEIVPLFAWCQLNSESEFQGGRDLYPSARGMFDLMGNYEEALWRGLHYQNGDLEPAKLRDLQLKHLYVRGGTIFSKVEDFDVFDDRRKVELDGLGILKNSTLRLVRTYCDEGTSGD